MQFKFGLKDSEKLVQGLLEMGKRGQKAVDRAVYEFGQVEMKEMKRRVPVDTGTLKDSGFVEKPVRDGMNVRLTLGFGGAAEAYAIYVHEDLEAVHRVGEAKFVESVLNESTPYFAVRVAQSLYRELGLSFAGKA
jgi:hypothetical protein